MQTSGAGAARPVERRRLRDRRPRQNRSVHHHRLGKEPPFIFTQCMGLSQSEAHTEQSDITM